ncbi:DsbA family oxidoreductase [Streptomyces sp. NPDC046805]|uniref:DsbA family oxidoreductase n=1 Tax=Streptomyces sp. NPDC046805 TaxID=3155134 RepID=UPI0033EB52A6
MKIDIWSDVICPFCYIGKRKLELALEKTGIEVEVKWHSFELNPDAPRSYGVPLPDMLSRMYGLSPAQALAVLEQEQREAARVGLDFRWRIAKPGNTFDAHRLLHLADSKGLGDQAEERFSRGYFTEGQDIGDPEALRRMAVESGLAAEDVDAVLSGDRFAAEVRADEHEAHELGIRGVPYFVINGHTTISGARDVEEFERVLREQADWESDEVLEGVGMCTDGFCEFTPEPGGTGEMAR